MTDVCCAPTVLPVSLEIGGGLRRKSSSRGHVSRSCLDSRQRLVPTNLLLSCDVTNPSCALHKLRWRSMAKEAIKEEEKNSAAEKLEKGTKPSQKDTTVTSIIDTTKEQILVSELDDTAHKKEVVSEPQLQAKGSEELQAPLAVAANKYSNLALMAQEASTEEKQRAPEESPESEPEDLRHRRNHSALSDGDAPLSEGDLLDNYTNNIETSSQHSSTHGGHQSTASSSIDVSPTGISPVSISSIQERQRSASMTPGYEDLNISMNKALKHETHLRLHAQRDLPTPSPGLESYDSLVATGSTSLRLNRARGAPLLIRRSSSNTSSTTADGTGGEWGFYEDCDLLSRESTSRLELAASEADRVTPEYVLEDSLEYQALWHSTAGRRPPQPPNERQKYEQLWSQNFAQSQVDYGPEGSRAVAAAAATQIRQSSNPRLINSSAEWNSGFGASHYGAGGLHKSGFGQTGAMGSASTMRNTMHQTNVRLPPPPSTETPNVIPLLREQSPFGTSAARSWTCPACGELSSLMIHIPKYQIVQEGAFDVRAEYLVVVKLRFVTFGLWRRYSHFERLANKIFNLNRPLDFENTLGSWRCVKRRQKWCRCLDKDYIVLKCFLLERFLHDAVFESASSDLFLDFLEIQLPDDIDT